MNLGTSGPGANIRLSGLGIWAMVMAILNHWLLSANTALPRKAVGAGEPPAHTFSVVNDSQDRLTWHNIRFILYNIFFDFIF